MLHQFQREQIIPGNPAGIWDFFATPHNLDALTPPELRFQIVSETAPRMYAGQLIDYRISIFPGVWMRWLTEIRHVHEGRSFVDEQRHGPYKFWYHEHHFEPIAGGVKMTDRVTYDVGWGWPGALVERVWVRPKLQRIFNYRAQQVTARFGAT